MAIDVNNAHTFYEEIRSHEKARDHVLESGVEIMTDYHGPYYKAKHYIPENPAPENLSFQYMAWLTPKVIFHNPVVEVESRHAGIDREIPLRMMHRLNDWAKETDIWTELREVWYNMMIFGHGVTYTSMEYLPKGGGYQQTEDGELRGQRPISRSVSPWEFIIDHRCKAARKARLMGHAWAMDKEDLEKVPGVIHKNVAAMMLDSNAEKVEPRWLGWDQRPKRGRVFGYSIWIPEIPAPGYEGNPLFNGSIYEIGVSLNGDGTQQSKPQWIREPRPFFGRPQGPYQMFGVYEVPGQVYPLSPITATRETAESLNAHVSAADEGAANYKRFIGYEASNPNLGHTLVNAEHGSVNPMYGLGRGEVQTLETGGVDEKQYLFIDRMYNRWERSIGFSEGDAGGTGSGSTATEYADVAEQRDARISEIRQMFAFHTRGMFDAVGWLLYYSKHVASNLGEGALPDLKPRPLGLPPESKAWEVQREMRMKGDEQTIEEVQESLRWPPKGEELMFPSEKPEHAFQSMHEIWNIPYNSLQLMVDAVSMGRTDQALMQRRVQDQFKLVSEASGVMATTPWINWPEQFDKYGEALNMKGFSEVINKEELREAQEFNKMAERGQFAADQQAQQGEVAPGGGGGVQPEQGMGTQPAAMQTAQQTGANLAAAYSPV